MGAKHESLDYPEGLEPVPLDKREVMGSTLDRLLTKNQGVIFAASGRTERILRKEAVDPLEFTDVFLPEEISADMRQTTLKEAGFKVVAGPQLLMEKLAFAAEGLLYHQIGVADWLSSEGVRTYVEKASKPDDILRGNDLVVEFDMGGDKEPLALSVDLAVGPDAFRKKIGHIREKIDAGTLTEVRYHIGPDGAHNPLSRTPKVVVGMSPEKAVAVSRLWTSEDKNDTARLKEHPIQVAIVRQIDLQLKAYEQYARAKGKTELAERFARAGAAVGKILKEKESKLKDDPTAAAGDTVAQIRLALTELSPAKTGDRPYETNVRANRWHV